MVNRLANEISPYLLQHASNPVDWQPWDAAATSEARMRDVPILLSIGYAACHWCHVMEHESFSNESTAALMNRNFVCIKVDREERPDLDAIYMEAVQAMTGSGGWPMTVFLTPDGKPFYGGTYFPPTDRHGLPAFSSLLTAISESWQNKRADVEDQARRLTGALDLSTRLSKTTTEPDGSLVADAVDRLRNSFDERFGGFSGAPKFPQPMVIDLLLRAGAAGDRSALEMALKTLDAMSAGGMFDQLGGGFHRYSVDATWTVPHFEKMLYDNALLLRTYARAYLLAGNPRHLEVAEATAAWMLDEMRDPCGGFYSSLDADSEGEEGRYYVWDLSEFVAAADHLAPIATEAWGITQRGNFEGSNIPVFTGADPGPEVQQARALLLQYRSKRVRPATDDKVLAAWNGLAASSLAEAGAALGHRRWVQAAGEAAGFVLTRMRRKDRLVRSARRARDGSYSLGPAAFCEDHAALVEACLALFEATGEARWLTQASSMARATVDLFADPAGGFFSTGADAEALVTRPKDVVDNAVPSSNSILALELQRLALITGEAYEEVALGCLELVHDAMKRSPFGFAHALCAADLWSARALEIVVVGPGGEELADAVRHRFLPNKVLVDVVEDGELSQLPLLQGRARVGDEAAAYVCTRGTCRAPVTTVAEMLAEVGVAV
jgi:uncharacterized protein YyaL (SSP411 family)